MASLPLPVYLLSLAVLFGTGIWICERTADELADHDPAAIVWDEVVGLLTAMIAAPAGWTWLVAGFVLFRFFDIVKPWPVRAAERAPGGLGIMLDDLVAGVLGLAVLQLAAFAVDASV